MILLRFRRTTYSRVGTLWKERLSGHGYTEIINLLGMHAGSEYKNSIGMECTQLVIVRTGLQTRLNP